MSHFVIRLATHEFVITTLADGRTAPGMYATEDEAHAAAANVPAVQMGTRYEVLARDMGMRRVSCPTTSLLADASYSLAERRWVCPNGDDHLPHAAV